MNEFIYSCRHLSEKFNYFNTSSTQRAHEKKKKRNRQKERRKRSAFYFSENEIQFSIAPANKRRREQMISLGGI